jgi:hypothetical protein
MQQAGSRFAPRASSTPGKTGAQRGLWIVVATILCAGGLIAGGIYLPEHGSGLVGVHKHSAPQGSRDSNAKLGPTETNANPAPQLTSHTGSPVSARSTSSGTAPDTRSLSGVPNRDSASAVSSATVPPVISDSADQTKIAELEQLQDQADKLRARANSIAQSLDALRQQQASSGWSLRGDIGSAEQRLQLYLSRADGAIQDGKSANARKDLELAETEAARLENFLNK